MLTVICARTINSVPDNWQLAFWLQNYCHFELNVRELYMRLEISTAARGGWKAV
jgi:hypothetical protein